MQYFTYPQTIDPDEARLLRAVNLYYNGEVQRAKDMVAFALRVDASHRTGLFPHMRAEFVWKVMTGPICDSPPDEGLPLMPWVTWWQQRWRDKPHAPEFEGMYATSRQALCLWLAKISEIKVAAPIAWQHVTQLMGTLVEQQQLPWREVVELAIQLPCGRILQTRGQISTAPFPVFDMDDAAWQFIWAVIECARPADSVACLAIANLVHDATEYGIALDEYFAVYKSQQKHVLPQQLTTTE